MEFARLAVFLGLSLQSMKAAALGRSDIDKALDGSLGEDLTLQIITAADLGRSETDTAVKGSVDGEEATLEKLRKQFLKTNPSFLAPLLGATETVVEIEKLTDVAHHTNSSLRAEPHSLDDVLQSTDAYMRVLQPEERADCESQARALIRLTNRDADSKEANAHKAQLINTGVFLANATEWPNASQKLRLGVLSFLATQDLQHTKLHFWTDVDMNHTILQQALGPILAHGNLAQSVSVGKFDLHAELAKLDPEMRHVLARLYNDDSMLASKSDLMRAILLHNYGGMWVDSDVLMLHDFAPLMNKDWAYLGEQHFINGALLSVSKPKSHFISYYLASVVNRSMEATGDYDSLAGRYFDDIYKFGPRLLTDLHTNPATAGSFHVLPTCFFDGTWAGELFWPFKYEDFFRRPATDEEVMYITPSNPNSTAFAYHWHGRWNTPVADGSLSDRAEQMYLDKLQIVL